MAIAKASANVLIRGSLPSTPRSAREILQGFAMPLAVSIQGGEESRKAGAMRHVSRARLTSWAVRR
jgi:hypothetical protein